MTGNEQMNIFDVLGDYGFEDTKAESTEEAVAESTETEAAAVTEEASSDNSGKKPEAKKTAKKSAKTLAGPVKVVGTGWVFEYGDPGVKYDPKDAIKAAFNEGYKEVSLSLFTMPKNGSVVYVNALGRSASSDNLAMGKEITVILGRKAANYKAEDFPGLDEDEISLADVCEKFVESHPEFKGCALNCESGDIAVPVFEDKYTLNRESSGTVRVWGENGISEYPESEATLLFENATFYRSEAGVLFPVYEVRGKGSSTVYMTASDFNLTASSPKKEVEEKYALPFNLYLETFGQRKVLESTDFNGKVKVTKQEVIDWLKPQYKAFQSKSRKFDVIYEKAQNIVSVALISGEKGAAVIAAFPTLLFPRVEKTDIGVFSGTQRNDGEVLGLNFSFSLPKIPRSILNTVIAEFRRTGDMENMLQVFWNKSKHYYYIRRPEQEADRVSVRYRLCHSKDVLVLTIHSHNRFSPEWSETDNEDEVYTGLFGVIGHIDRPCPSMRLRAGMEGCFKELDASDVFESEAA